jgi:streptogrisin C
MTRTRLHALAATAAVATALCALPAAGASAGGASAEAAPSSRPDTGQSVAEMAARWLAQDAGIALEDARDRVAAQDSQSAKAAALEKRLGAKAAGSYIDQETGALVVNVRDAAAARTVRSEGATPRTVAFTQAQLRSAERTATSRAGADLVSSAIDPVSNRVVLTVPADRVAVVSAKVKDLHGVTVQGTTARVTTQANVYGGQQIEFSGYVCSLGFNATKGAANVFITAGHCAEGYQTFRRNGVTLGSTQAYSFPGNDYAYSSLTSSWTGVGAVDMYDGYARRVTGSSSAAVGSAVCKSGRTTDWTCGSIQAKNVTVNYNNGDGTYSTVSGLTQSNTCTEGGDSGGSWMSSTLAQGVTSGGAGYGANAVCGEKVGQPNIAYFQPVGEILSAYGLTLKTS